MGKMDAVWKQEDSKLEDATSQIWCHSHVSYRKIRRTLLLVILRACLPWLACGLNGTNQYLHHKPLEQSHCTVLPFWASIVSLLLVCAHVGNASLGIVSLTAITLACAMYSLNNTVHVAIRCLFNGLNLLFATYYSPQVLLWFWPMRLHLPAKNHYCTTSL